MPNLTRFWPIAVAVTILGTPGCTAQDRPDDLERHAVKSTAQERKKAFEWFNGLGYPDVKGLKFVRVATGHWYSAGGNPETNTYLRGFLLSEEGDRFRVLALSLSEDRYQKTPAGTPAFKQVDYKATELRVGAAAYLKNLRKPPKDRVYDGAWMRTGLLSGTETFILAWACWRNGFEDLATDLFEIAPHGFNVEPPPKKPLVHLVAADISRTEMWRAVLACGEDTPRTELLQHFERIVKHFPGTEYHKDSKAAVELLTRMIQEDTEHAKGRKPFDKLSTQEKVTELIFQLRDQNGHQLIQPGSCDIFDRFRRGSKDTPAHKLVQIGYDAVPQLIEHLDDNRFTRSVGFHRNFYFSHYVLRVSDCALAIIERIAGRSFWRASSTFSYMSMDKKSADAKKQVQAWFAEFSKKGEQRFLTEATERGDGDSGEMGRRLLERYPKHALPILIKGAKATKVGHVRATLVALIASRAGDESLQFLLTELKDGPLAQPRLTAAEELYKRGRPEGLGAMIAWWKSGADLKKGVKRHQEDPSEWAWYIARFLVNCGEMQGIQALAKDLHKQPVNSRLQVISVLGGRDEPFGFEKKPPKDPGKRSKTVEALLIAALDDRVESRSSKEFPETRVCDAAAQALKELYPTKYSFDPAVPASARNRQLIIIKNVWRSANMLPPLLPGPRKMPPLPANTLRPILDRYLATRGDQRIATRKEIEQLGLGTLPAVIERRDKAGDKSEQAVWNDLATRLASIVVEIEFAEQSVRPSAIVQKRVESLKGKPFDAKAFIETIGVILRNAPNHAQGVRVVAMRAADGTGFSLAFDLLANPKQAKGPPSQWGYSERIQVGKRHLRGQFSATSDAGITQWQDGNYPDLEKALAQAAASAPNQPVDIRIHVAPEWRE